MKSYRTEIMEKIHAGESRIVVNWHVFRGTLAQAEDLTEAFYKSGYVPDLEACAPDYRHAYAHGIKVNGGYIRLPHEVWTRSE